MSHKRASVNPAKPAKTVEVRLADLEALEARGLIVFEHDEEGRLRLRLREPARGKESIE
jgi:hypothetical protein